MIEHTTHIMYNIVLMNIMIHLKNEKSNLIDIGYGQMGVWISSNLHGHSIGYVVFIKNKHYTLLEFF
jgi:hypothetical protein